MKVQEEEALREQFKKEISEARKEWTEICAALRLINEEDPVAKLKRDPSTRDLEEDGSSGVSLQWEYEAMMERLETLRSIKHSAVSDMQASQSRIFKAFAALNGISIQEASQANEMQSYLDMEMNLTHERREEFRIKAQEYDESVWTRTRAVVSLVLDCQTMIHELEIVPPTEEVSFGRSDDDFKIMNSLQPIDDVSQTAGGNAQELLQQHRPGGGTQGKAGRGNSNNYTIVDVFESSTCIGIGNSALDRLTSRIAELNGEKRRRRAKLGEMGSIISTLWTMLRISPDEQKAFTMSIRGLGLDTIRKGEAEIARLEEIKGVMIGKLVREQRSIIEELWEKTNSSANERASFNAYYQIQDDDQLTSDILVKHEDYAATLEAKLQKMQPILNLIAKREAILEERIELDLLQKDPDRLKGRGATKQLMKEEKMSRRVMKELPKITSILEETLRQWYAENKSSDGVSDPDMGHFMYNGSPYLQTMHLQEEEWRTRKERNDEERQRKRQEERDASSSNAAFGTTYMKLPGKKWNPLTETQSTAVGSAAAAAASSRPRSASTARSGPNIQSEGPHLTSRSNNSNMQRSGSTLRLGGGRGPLGEVSNTRPNASSRPPSRPRGAGEGGIVQGKKMAGTQGFRPSSAPRTRL
jgi:protein regulator of cytokinesis 1